ncbi:MAG: DEAD/DEAH box helicase [Gammaproteobacteria bacterium]|nr:MAG: DEAD/DEAH box helicase [Gammaproteobacteria bacterium]
MKIQYELLDYQTEAVDSVIDLLNFGSEFYRTNNDKGFLNVSVVGNEFEIDKKLLQQNLGKIQTLNSIENNQSKIIDDNLADFSVEMETGTGKTFVYLKTIFQLYKNYDLKKFIIIVPSVAIREGVLKTLQCSVDYFYKNYQTRADYMAYEGQSNRKISTLNTFVNNNNLSILLMSIQAFNSDNNIINEARDDAMGQKMIDIIATTKPVLVLDEPQNMESDLSKSAIGKLNPLIKLRYSATHKNYYNLLYRLSAFDAYNKGLVKKIEIASVVVDDPNSFIFEPLKIILKKGASPQVAIKVEIKNNQDEYQFKTLNFKLSENIFLKTNNLKYKDLRINEISTAKNGAGLSDGRFFVIGKNDDLLKEDIFRTQIRETINNHFIKQQQVGKNIKVLSLFFIDRVKNYVPDNGFIKTIFNEEFDELKKQFPFFKNKKSDEVQNGYFSKSGNLYKDTRGDSQADKKTYDLIMKDKFRLLSFDEPTCFIFSHSALKEGWDNPNVFNICTLNETKSIMKKRQEIGRGMRLCLDITGKRVYDSNTNKLIVVPNESYQDYVATLQSEFKTSGQKGFTPADRNKRVVVKFKKQFATDNKSFKILWQKISQKTRYNIKINSEEFIKNTIKAINDRLSVGESMIKIQRQDLSFSDKNIISSFYNSEQLGAVINTKNQTHDIVKEIGSITNLTYKTITTILQGIENFAMFDKNPAGFTRSVIVIFKQELRAVIVNGIEYFKIDQSYKMELFKDIETYQNKTIASQKSIYDKSIFDSAGEMEFAKNLDKNDNVRLFAKLPNWFVVDTPVGDYNPDWAIVWQEQTQKEKLYLVRESKFVDDLMNLRTHESDKIICAKEHFEAIDVDFKTCQDQNLNDLFG